MKTREELFREVRRLDRRAREATAYREGLEKMRDTMAAKYPWLKAEIESPQGEEKEQMSTSAPMRQLMPRVYWADRRNFVYPGIHVWMFGDHWRVLPVPRKRGARP